MSKSIGSPKTGGRKKGTPNKSTFELYENLEKHNFDVVDQLMQILPQLSTDKKVNVLLELMSYLFPKRKAVEVLTAQPSKNETIKIEFVKPNRDRQV
ncbi:MAG: hypothetical protein WA160_06520 [Pseudobdellovibrio sp.]